MALSRTPIGTNKVESPDGVDTVSILGKDLGTGQTLVVIPSSTAGDGSNAEPPTTVTWNGHALTRRANAGAGSVNVSIWVLDNSPAGTGDIVATFGNLHGELEILASIVDGADAASFDQKAENTATSATHTTGATPATTVADTILIGAIAEVNTAPSGTTQAPFTNGQSVNNSSADWWMSLRESYAIVSATGAYTLQATVGSNVEYAAAVVALKIAADVPGGGSGNLTPGGMSSARSLKIGL